MSRIKHTFSFTVGSEVPPARLVAYFDSLEMLRGIDIKHVKSEELPDPIQVGTKFKVRTDDAWYFTVRAYDAESDKCLVVSSAGDWTWAHGADVRSGVIK